MTYNELCQDKRVQERFEYKNLCLECSCPTQDCQRALGHTWLHKPTFDELWKWWMEIVEKKYGKEDKTTLWQRALSEFYHCTWNGYESLEHALLACILERSEK